MRAAIQAARIGVERGAGGPFGACIVREGSILAVAANQVLETHDATAHAEVCAIRLAGAKLQSHLIERADIYSTTEPCPMCFSAIHWARIRRVIYGTSISDVQALGFNELTIPNEQMKQCGGSSVEIVPEFMREECLDLLRAWLVRADRQVY